MVTLHALLFVSEAGMSRPVLKMDAIDIRTDLSPFDMIIKDIKYIIFMEFTQVKVASMI
jgi:hypothetical protein